MGAMASFKAAAKSAADVRQLAMARANAAIVEKSSMGKYSPRFGSGNGPIDILPMDSRRQAMLALKADLWSQNKSQIDAAMSATTLPPIEKVFVPVANMYFLELAASGDAADMDQTVRDLGQHVYTLMRTEVNRYSRTIDQMTQMANSSSGDGWNDTRRGLISTEKDQLKDAAAYLVKLRDRATEYRGIANKLGGNEQRWDNLVLDINDTLADADALYQTANQ
jgi:hypothetical protein